MNSAEALAQKRKLLNDLNAWMLVKDDSMEFGLWFPERVKEKAEELPDSWKIQFEDLYVLANNLLRLAGTFVNYKYAKAVSFADIAVIEFCLNNMNQAKYSLLRYMNLMGQAVGNDDYEHSQQLLMDIWPAVSGQIRSMVADMVLLASILKTRYQDVLAA